MIEAPDAGKWQPDGSPPAGLHASDGSERLGEGTVTPRQSDATAAGVATSPSFDAQPELACADVDLDAYLDLELRPPERAIIEQHLSGCDTCRRELELLRLITGSLRETARPEPSEPMRQRLLAAVGGERPQQRIEFVCVECLGERVNRTYRVLVGPGSGQAEDRVGPVVSAPVAARVSSGAWSAASKTEGRCVVTSYCTASPRPAVNDRSDLWEAP